MSRGPSHQKESYIMCAYTMYVRTENDRFCQNSNMVRHFQPKTVKELNGKKPFLTSEVEYFYGDKKQCLSERKSEFTETESVSNVAAVTLTNSNVNAFYNNIRYSDTQFSSFQGRKNSNINTKFFFSRIAIYMSHVMRKPVLAYANNKGADQPAHPRGLISAFVFSA